MKAKIRHSNPCRTKVYYIFGRITDVSDERCFDMIDWQQVATLREEVGAEDFEEVVELFLQEVDEEIETLDATASDLGAKLHFLKGSALNLGFREFSNLCQSGESSLKQDPDASVDIGALLNSYQSSRSAFLSDLPTHFAG